MLVWVCIDAFFFSDLACELFYKTLNTCQCSLSKSSLYFTIPFQMRLVTWSSLCIELFALINKTNIELNVTISQWHLFCSCKKNKQQNKNQQQQLKKPSIIFRLSEWWNEDFMWESYWNTGIPVKSSQGCFIRDFCEKEGRSCNSDMRLLRK